MTEKDTIRVISEGKPSVLYPKKYGGPKKRGRHSFSGFSKICITSVVGVTVSMLWNAHKRIMKTFQPPILRVFAFILKGRRRNY